MRRFIIRRLVRCPFRGNSAGRRRCRNDFAENGRLGPGMERGRIVTPKQITRLFAVASFHAWGRRRGRRFFIPFSRVDATWASWSVGECKKGCSLRSVAEPATPGRLWSVPELTPLLFYPLRRCSRDCGTLPPVQSSSAKEWRPRDCFSVSKATQRKESRFLSLPFSLSLSLSLSLWVVLSLSLFLVHQRLSLVLASTRGSRMPILELIQGTKYSIKRSEWAPCLWTILILEIARIICHE